MKNFLVVFLIMFTYSVLAQSFTPVGPVLQDFEDFEGPTGDMIWTFNGASISTAQSFSANQSVLIPGLDQSIESESLNKSDVVIARLSFRYRTQNYRTNGGSKQEFFYLQYSDNNGEDWYTQKNDLRSNGIWDIYTINLAASLDSSGDPDAFLPPGFRWRILTGDTNSSNDLLYIDDITTSLYYGELNGTRFEGGTLTIGAGTFFETENISIDGGNIIINSNASSSGSFIAKGTVTNNTGTKPFTYNRNLPDTDWYIFSSPVANNSVEDFISNNSTLKSSTNGNRKALGTYKPGNNSGNRWNYYENANSFPDNTLVQGKAYATSLTSSGDLTLIGDFSNIVDGKVSVTKSSPSNSHLFYASGNPFMSHYSLNDFLNDNVGAIDQAYLAAYVWDGSNYVGKALDDNIILSPGQGFLVRLQSNSSSILNYFQSKQTHQNNNTFFGREEEKAGINLFIESKGRIAKTHIAYRSHASDKLNPGYDLAAFSSKKFDIHSKLVSEDLRDLNYNRQTLSDLSFEEDVIPLSISNAERQIVEFRVDYNAIPEQLEIYLEDKLAQQYYNLKENSAQIVVDKGINSQGRFFLHTKPAEFWIEDNTEDDSQDDSVFDLADGIASKAFDFFNLKGNILHFEGVNSKEQVKVNLFNLNGYKVFNTTKDLESDSNSIQLPYTLSEGVYIVELYRASGKKITKKIIVR